MRARLFSLSTYLFHCLVIILRSGSPLHISIVTSEGGFDKDGGTLTLHGDGGCHTLSPKASTSISEALTVNKPRIAAVFLLTEVRWFV